MKKIFLFVPGILTIPGESDNWTGRAVTWVHIHTPYRAEKVEYLSTPMTRQFWQAHRAKKLARTLSFYSPAEWDRVIIGHSNGCDVILDALRADGWPPVEALHLIAGACSGDFAKTGLAQAQRDQAVKRVVVYSGGRDAALGLAGTVFGKILGFGTLGSTGPVNHELDTTHLVHEPDYGHGTWFDTSQPVQSRRSNFDMTMGQIVSGAINT